MALTDTWLKNTTGKLSEKAFEQTDRDGLSVRVSAKGKVVFQMRFRFNGKMQRCDIGSYPLISLKAAREECQRYRAELEKGFDPRVVKATRIIENGNISTVSDHFDMWNKSFLQDNRVGAEGLWNSIQNHIIPAVGNLPTSKVTVNAWLSVFEPIAKKSPSMAGRLLSLTKQMLKWCVRRQLIDRNVLDGIFASRDLNVARKSKDRVLNDAEIRLIYDYINSTVYAEPVGLIFIQLCLLYGCRNGELRMAKKADIDLAAKIWTIPAENRKYKSSGKALKRPIPDEFVPFFKQLLELNDSEYLVPLRGQNAHFTRSSTGSLPYKIINWHKRRGIDMAHWSMHDLRRTARTHFSTLTQPHIAEIMLDHALPGVWQVYDRHSYMEEQVLAYQAWFARVQHVILKISPQ